MISVSETLEDLKRGAATEENFVVLPNKMEVVHIPDVSVYKEHIEFLRQQLALKQTWEQQLLTETKKELEETRKLAWKFRDAQEAMRFMFFVLTECHDKSECPDDSEMEKIQEMTKGLV